MALGEHAKNVPMSSLKSQIGHAQGACGAAGMAATLLAMETGNFLRPSTWRSPTRNATWTTFLSLAGTRRLRMQCVIA